MYALSGTKVFGFAAAVAFLFLTGMLGPRANWLDSNQLEARARRLVSERYHLPVERLVVAGRGQHLYPTHELMVHEYKVLSKVDGVTYGLALDQAGIEVNTNELLKAQSQLQGRIDPLLANKLRTAPDDERLEVVIWLKEAQPQNRRQRPSPGSKMSQAEVDAYSDSIRTIDPETAAIRQTVIDRLALLGVRRVAEDPSAPLLDVELSASIIHMLSNWPEVQMIYSIPQPAPLLEIARKAIHADKVQLAGIDGTGVKIVDLEPGRINGNNPYLANVVQDTTHLCPFLNIITTSHATGVVGIIRSRDTTRKGIAPGANVRVGGSCKFKFTEMTAATNRAYNWGAKVFNLSWGAQATNQVLTGWDLYYDRFVLEARRTVVVAAGDNEHHNWHVDSPGLAYNVITVGNFNDWNTVSWSDDQMGSVTAYVDPYSNTGDREKPELVAPGTNINSTIMHLPWTGAIGSGTSFSAPVVTGVVALMMQTSPPLQEWPEAVKAILMATAFNNIEGAATLSERDGAGGIDALRAYRAAIMKAPYPSWWGTQYTCDQPADPFEQSMSVVAGRATRVAIVWDQNPNYSFYSSRPSADLDLFVYDPSAHLVASSTSFDNTYEIASFVPSTSGIYTFKVQRHRCDLAPGWLGWAYYHD